jgi:CDGSH-type Zn-finger protein/uncharacterized Fe-S cluster protein YjdI
MLDIEPAIIINSREQLLYTLIEAAEIEHNLMCCYLYAAWSLKTEDGDGLPPQTLAELRRWQRTIFNVAIDEMTHLALVANLQHALGGVAHFNRPNFPIGRGYHPAGMAVRLAPFDRQTLQHFVHLERPEGNAEPDGIGFAQAADYERHLYGLCLMPSAQDYATVGHLYRSLKAGIKNVASQIGEAALFCGDPALQVGPDIVQLDGLRRVTDLASAIQAIETIVEQGEGAQSNTETGHFQRFISVRDAYDRMLAEDPGFQPAHPAAHNPVMRRPPDATGLVWIELDETRALLDVGNAIYNHMLRFLSHGFGASAADDKRLYLNTAIDLMMAVDPIARELARMKANHHDACNAGLSFSTLRALVTPQIHAGTMTMLVQRLDDICDGFGHLKQNPRILRARDALTAIRGRLATPAVEGHSAAPLVAEPGPGTIVTPAPASAMPTEPAQDAAPEIVEGRDLTLIVDGKRCIHARYCVTGAPKTFVANVVGPWLHPDETPADRLIEIAHACPSGAVAYRRKDGRPDEAAPDVNLIRLRENGPYAVHAPMLLGGAEIGMRVTLCRCGASNNKPFCDGSHNQIGFAATGEPATISTDALGARNGPLHVAAMQNGPLKIEGNLEICAGTGRVVKRVTEAALCRCGHSGHKPFCDGSHRAAGFVADAK